MWKRNITVEVSIGKLTSTLKILLNFINIFIIYFAFRQQMKARLRSNITFYQVLIKIKVWLTIAWVKLMTSYSITESFLNFYGIKSNVKI